MKRIVRHATSDFIEYVKEQLASIHKLTSTRFFGGVALALNGTQFGMIMDDVLYFVVDDSTRPNYEKLGSHCFSYATKNRQVKVNRYFEVPAQAIENQDELLALATESLAVARNSRGAKAKRALHSGNT